MATTLNAQGKYDVLNVVKGLYTSISLFQTIDTDDYTNSAPACDSAVSISSSIWTLSGTTLSNNAAIVFNCTAGDIPYKVVLFSSSTTGGIVIDLTGAAGDAFLFASDGTFTIPIGDLTISVA